jgi:Holliday junction DNA helicase RuvA
LELKGKLEQTLAETPAMAASTDAEVVEALMALGYSASEARRAVSDGRDSAGLSVEERIRLALQTFGPG